MPEQALQTITENFLEPLNRRTQNLLNRINVKNDYLVLKTDDDNENFIAEFYALLDGRRTFASWNAHKLIKRIPERKAINEYERIYKFAGTDFTALIINASWPVENLIFEGNAKLLFDFLLMRFLRQTKASRLYADYKINGVVPEDPPDFYDHPEFPLSDFQKIPVFAQHFIEGSNLWMEQGTGKTPIVISRINYEAHQIYKNEKRMYRALIVVPKNVRTSWQNKIEQFAIYPGRATILTGNQLKRIKLLTDAFKLEENDNSEYTIVICSYDTVLRSWNAMKYIKWDFCCLDEAHMIKSSSTKRWKQIKELRSLCKCRVGLTGTPFANSLFDVFTQLEWLGHGMSGFTSFKAFRSYYGKFLPRNETRQFDVLKGYQNLPILQERIARLAYQITRKEALPYLPAKTYDVIDVMMTPEQKEFYMKIRDQLMVELKEDLKTLPKQLTASHILTKLLRLSQITAGFLKWDAQYADDGTLLNEEHLIEEITPNPKIEALLEFLATTNEKQKVIIWCDKVPAIHSISRALTKNSYKHVTYYGGTKDKARNEAERAYNEDADMKCFVGNPAAGGTGLDLWGYIPRWVGTEKDHGCNTEYVIYFSQNWSMIHRSQSEDRAMRSGTRAPVQYIDLLVPGSIDVEIAKRVLQKQLDAAELQDVRAVMKRVLESVPNMNEE